MCRFKNSALGGLKNNYKVHSVLNDSNFILFCNYCYLNISVLNFSNFIHLKFESAID